MIEKCMVGLAVDIATGMVVDIGSFGTKAIACDEANAWEIRCNVEWTPSGDTCAIEW